MEMQSFREFAREECRKAFGEPEVLRVEGGEIDRWTLKRPEGPELYVTLDAPELENLVHLLISDPGSTLVDPIASVVLRTKEELEQTIERIKAQWACSPNQGE